MNYKLLISLLALFGILSSANAYRVGDPSVTFDACKYDPDYPEMLEWQKAGVEGGIPWYGSTPIKLILSAGNSDNINAAIAQVAALGGGQLRLNNGTYIIDKTINMVSNVRIVGQSQTGTILNITMTGTSGSAIRFTGVQKSGIDNLTIQGSQGTPTPFLWTDAKPNFMITSISLGSGSKNCWFQGLVVKNSGNLAIDIYNCSHITVRDCILDGSWNKGGGGHGYVQFSGSYCLMYNTSVKKMRHIAIQNQYCKYNVFYQNNVEQDFNFHNADAGYNLVEQNVSRLPAGMGTAWHSMMGPWSIQHAEPGPKNAIYKNNCIEYNNGGAVTFSNNSLVYLPVRHENNIPFNTSINTPIGGTFYPVSNITISSVIASIDESKIIDNSSAIAYPSQFKSVFTMKNCENYTKVQIINVKGQVVFSSNIEKENEMKIDLSDKKSGLYIVKLIGQEELKSIKVIKF